jgi:hypothetical protein
MRTPDDHLRCDFCGMQAESLSVLDYFFRWNRAAVWTGEVCDKCLEKPPAGIEFFYEEEEEEKSGL